MGTIVGFVVGMLISYQVIYTDLSDQLPQYATLKAMGYGTRYLLRVVLATGGIRCICRLGPGLARSAWRSTGIVGASHCCRCT